MRYACANQRRLRAVAAAGLLNGIEYVEVRDTDEPVTALRQRTLFVRLLLAPPVDGSGALVGLAATISGGEVITGIGVVWAARADALPAGVPTSLVADIDDPDTVLVVRTTDRGDFSTYRLALVAAPGSAVPPAGFDPLLVEVDFGFKVECPGDGDCAHGCTCGLGSARATGAGTLDAAQIDYLAKDFQGFRRLMLDRMALLAPAWTERNPADVGVAVVEMLAYVADELSYRQDAVATEAYLGTARSRVSLRRLARLVDYRVHEGCNARAWVGFEVTAPGVLVPAGTTVLTRVPDVPARIVADSPEHAAARAAGPVVFRTVEDVVADPDLATLAFYTWGEQDCSLPAGSTRATLRGDHPALLAGDVLVLGDDRDPTTRVAVRLVEVTAGTDPSGAVLPDGSPTVTEIRWHNDDALVSPLCLDVAGVPVARALGNMVLADHGDLVADEGLGVVPEPRLRRVGACPDPAGAMIPARFRPTLARRALTRAVAAPLPVLFHTPATPVLLAALDAGTWVDPLPGVLRAHGIAMPSLGVTVRGADPAWSITDGVHAFRCRHVGAAVEVVDLLVAPAAPAIREAPREALPALRLVGTVDGVADVWTAQPDLLASEGGARDVTVETEHDGTVLLRFGDDEHGMRPEPGTQFNATYRIGNGRAGNVAREAIAHVVSADSGIAGVSNPVPASGGVEPESADEIRRSAPFAFVVQERAVTEADYAEVTQRHGRVQRAAATFRWTGSWHTAFVTADRLGGAAVDQPFETDVRAWLERYRMACYDLEVDGPVHVPLEVALHVCVARGYFPADVSGDVRAVLSSQSLPGGGRGLFHPDNLTFGQAVYSSAVIAAVQAIAGVSSVEVGTFQRQHQPETSGIPEGVLTMGRLEIAQLDDDPNHRERGLLTLTFGGGS